MQAIKKAETIELEPEVLDANTTAATNKAERWEPGKQGITFHESLIRARSEHHAYQNAYLDRSA
jgi:hypothetical protein